MGTTSLGLPILMTPPTDTFGNLVGYLHGSLEPTRRIEEEFGWHIIKERKMVKGFLYVVLQLAFWYCVIATTVFMVRNPIANSACIIHHFEDVMNYNKLDYFQVKK